MIIIRALDVNGDWIFGKGKNDYISGAAAIVQDINCRLKSFLGDCFFAIDEGIDWFNLLGSKDRLALELAVRAVILNTKNVTGIVSVDSNFDSVDRELFLTYTVNSVLSSSGTGEPISGTVSFLTTEDGDILTTEDGTGLSLG